MKCFKIKISVLPQESKTKNHPLYNESEIVFEFKNCSVSDAVNCTFFQNEYKCFCKRNIIIKDIYVYYTDDIGIWHEYNDMLDI